MSITARGISGLLVILELAAADAARQGQPVARPDATGDAGVVVIHAYDDSLAGIRTANAGIHLTVERDRSPSGEAVLQVDYPAPTDDPAARDVQLTAAHHDWTPGRAISFEIKPDHAIRLSVSFLDRNHVAYTSWQELKGGVWQVVRIPFAEIRPNPFFQPPDARSGAPLDVSDVRGIAFAPQDQASGRLEVGRFVVTR